jgi:ribulose-5-phosphate 4-epimerase/fuculose-1-phosphate aldolase
MASEFWIHIQGETIGLIPYALPGSERLAQATADALGNGRALALWQYHGIVAVAPTLQTAFDLVYTANKAAKMALLCRSTGIAPKGLGKTELSELVKVWGLEE